MGGYNIVTLFEQDGLRIAHVPGRMAIEMTPEFRAGHEAFASELFRHFDQKMKREPSPNHEVRNKPGATSSILYFIPLAQEEAVAEDVLRIMIKHGIIRESQKAQTLQSFGLFHSTRFSNASGLDSISYDDDRFMHLHFISDKAATSEAMAERALQMIWDIPGLRVGDITLHEEGPRYDPGRLMRACLSCNFEPDANTREVVGKVLLALKEGKVEGGRPQPFIDAPQLDQAWRDLALPQRGVRLGQS